LPSTPWESAGDAGREKKLEVEERLPACSLSSPNFRELEFPASEEVFRVKEPITFSKEGNCFPLVSVARWGIRNGLSLRDIPGRMNEDSEIG
jgi:hypothetical protein